MAANRIKLSVSLLMGVFLVSLLGFGFYRVFGYARAVPVVGDALLLRLLGVIFLSLFVLIIYSSVITAFTTLYFSGDNDFLRVTPLHPGGILAGKLIHTLVYSSWMSLAVFLPLVFSLGYIFRPPLYAYGIFGAGSVLFFISAVSLGCAAVVIIVQVFPARKVRDFLVAGLIVSGTLLYILFRLLELESVLRPGETDAVSYYLGLLEVPRNIWVPSYWFTSLSGSLLKGRGGWASPLGALFLYAMVCLGIYYAVSSRLFYTGWEKVKSQERKRYRTRDISGNPVLAKDIRGFFRDTSQWTQTLLILALIVIYIVNIHKLPLDMVPFSNIIVAFLNIGMVCFVMAAVGLRFAFSSISLEGPYFWILLGSPYGIEKVVRTKFLENIIPVMVLGLILISVSNHLLEAAFSLRIVSTAAVFAGGVSMSCLAMGMGCVYPRFDARGPADIETSWGAVMYMTACFFYIALTLGLLGIWGREFFIYSVTGSPVSGRVYLPVVAGLFILNLAACILPMKAGISRIRKAESL